MKSRMVMGVAAYFLLMSAISFCVEAQPVQLSGVLIVDVDANTDVQVFWSIFGGDNPGVSITYTVYYARDLNDPTIFNSTSPDAIPVNASAGSNSITLPGEFLPGTLVTVVVVAIVDNEPVLESATPVTIQIPPGNMNIGAPKNVTAQRSNDNKVLEVSWLAIDSPLILSYDVEYRIFKTTGSSGFPSTLINSPGSINLKLTISNVDSDTNYEVRVRGVAEAPRDSTDVVNNGPWSEWYVSQVRLDPGFATGSATITSCNAIIFTVYLVVITIFLYFC